jgi:hypothetical protein
MGDYFAALAARALQPEKGVQPRPRVLFEEGLPAVAAVLPAATAAAGRPADAPADSDTATRQPGRARAVGNTAEPGTVELSPVRGRSHRRQGPQPATDDDAEAKIATPHEAVRAAVTPPAALELRDPGAPRSTTRRAVTGPAPDPAPALTRPRSIDRIDVVARRAGQRGEARPADMPTIRIHIGRVDVRAVAAAAPKEPARRDAKGPLMTLEDYLKRRVEGQS